MRVVRVLLSASLVGVLALVAPVSAQAAPTYQVDLVANDTTPAPGQTVTFTATILYNNAPSNNMPVGFSTDCDEDANPMAVTQDTKTTNVSGKASWTVTAPRSGTFYGCVWMNMSVSFRDAVTLTVTDSAAAPKVTAKFGFKTWSAKMTGNGKADLKKAYKKAKKAGKVTKVKVTGVVKAGKWTAANKHLAKKRVTAIVKYLKSIGVKAKVSTSIAKAKKGVSTVAFVYQAS